TNKKQKVRLPDFTPPIYAEASALYLALIHILQVNAQEVIICTDSLRLLDMLKNPATNPDITQIIRMIEFGIDEDRTIRFCWCPRRLTRFSKEVDELAKSCAEISSQPIPFCSISYTHQMIRYK